MARFMVWAGGNVREGNFKEECPTLNFPAVERLAFT